MKATRKLRFRDLFSLSRILTNAGIEMQEIEEIIKKHDEAAKKYVKLGYQAADPKKRDAIYAAKAELQRIDGEIIIKTLLKIINTSEDIIYDWLASFTDKTPIDIADSDLQEVFELVKDIVYSNAGEIKDFFEQQGTSETTD